MDYAKESLRLHYEWKGKLEMTPRAAVDSKEALSLAYTCLLYTARRNSSWRTSWVPSSTWTI